MRVPISIKRIRVKKYEEISLLLLLITISIPFVYLLPNILKSSWLIFLLFLYIRSKNESFWLAFFLVMSDGFFGFFGTYEVSVAPIPGLPAIEIAQFYILISIIKSLVSRKSVAVFYKKILIILFIYVVFLILVGQLYGLSGGLNVQFRVLKFTLPLLLFYTIPKLLTTAHDYENFFRLIFIISFTALVSQIFNVILGMSPAEYLGIKEIARYSEIYIETGSGYRGLFNPNVIIIAFFGALYYYSYSKSISPFNSTYLTIVLVGLYINMFLSATRGWILSFGIILFLFFLFIIQFRTQKTITFSLVLLAIAISTIMQPRISNQFYFSAERLSTVGNLFEGDESASGTLNRLTERGPAVIDKWKGSILFGWGFSDEYFANADGHVGNQNILLHSGIIGAILLTTFVLFFSYIMLITGRNFRRNPLIDSSSFYVFFVFLIGWLFLHTTSGQQFSFYNMPSEAIPQAVFFSFGSLNFYEKKRINSRLSFVRNK